MVGSGLWIPIHFFRIQIQLFFLCGSKSSLNKIVKNYLMKNFLELEPLKEIDQKYKNHGVMVQIYCKIVIKCQISLISLYFSVFSLNSSHWIRIHISLMLGTTLGWHGFISPPPPPPPCQVNRMSDIQV